MLWIILGVILIAIGWALIQLLTIALMILGVIGIVCLVLAGGITSIFTDDNGMIYTGAWVGGIPLFLLIVWMMGRKRVPQ